MCVCVYLGFNVVKRFELLISRKKRYIKAIIIINIIIVFHHKDDLTMGVLGEEGQSHLLNGSCLHSSYQQICTHRVTLY